MVLGFRTSRFHLIPGFGSGILNARFEPEMANWVKGLVCFCLGSLTKKRS